MVVKGCVTVPFGALLVVATYQVAAQAGVCAAAASSNTAALRQLKALIVIWSP
jgi:hypothetical protein